MWEVKVLGWLILYLFIWFLDLLYRKVRIFRELYGFNVKEKMLLKKKKKEDYSREKLILKVNNWFVWEVLVFLNLFFIYGL